MDFCDVNQRFENDSGVTDEGWLVDRLIKASGVAMLSAPERLGDTWLAADLAVAAVTANDFLGHKTHLPPGSAVVIASGVQSHRQVENRLSLLAKQRSGDLTGLYAAGLHLLCFANVPACPLDEGSSFRETVRALGRIGLIVLDGPPSQRNDDAWWAKLRVVQRETGAMVAVVSGFRAPPRRSSQKLAIERAVIDSLLLLRSSPGEPGRYECFAIPDRSQNHSLDFSIRFSLGPDTAAFSEIENRRVRAASDADVQAEVRSQS